MADAKISALTALTGAGVDSANDLFVVVDTSATETKNITPDEMKTLFGDVTGPGSATDNEVVVFNGATGKVVKASGTLIGALGDASGPGSSTDNAIARFDGAGGKTLQNSGVLISDNNEMTIPGNVANGQLMDIKAKEAEITGLSGATADESNFFTAGMLVLCVTTRVTTLITGATSFDIGDDVDTDAYGSTIALTAGTTTGLADYTIANPPIYVANRPLRLTANGSNFTAGAVRVTVYYLEFTAPTS